MLRTKLELSSWFCYVVNWNNNDCVESSSGGLNNRTKNAFGCVSAWALFVRELAGDDDDLQYRSGQITI